MSSLLSFLRLETQADLLRILKLPALVGLEAGKYLIMLDCGCELDTWVPDVIHHPYRWVVPVNTVHPPFVAAPYSPLYYLFNQPQQYGYIPWMSYLFLFDILLSTLVFYQHRWPWILFYSANSIFFFNQDTQDFFTFQIAMLGVYSWRWSWLAVVYKMPWFTLPFQTPSWFPFPPAYVWRFVLENPYGFHESLGRYVQLGMVWLVPLLAFLFYYRRHRIAIPYGYIPTLWYRLKRRIRDAKDDG